MIVISVKSVELNHHLNMVNLKTNQLEVVASHCMLFNALFSASG